MSTLIERIKTVIEECGDKLGEDKQAGLGRISGASNSVVSQWLSGAIKSLSPKYAINIEKKLGYNSHWLMLGEPHPKMKKPEYAPTPPNASPMVSTAERALLYVDIHELRLITAYREATELGRASIEETARLAPKRSIADYVMTDVNKPKSPDKK